MVVKGLQWYPGGGRVGDTLTTMTGPTAAPATERTIELRDGRVLAFCEWGDLDGSPVTLFHGTPGSRLFCPDEDATIAAHVRLITVDRPGYGRSDPHPGRTLLDGVDDFVQLADRLDLSGCPIIGWSGGGPYALACAARVPDRFPIIGLAASPGPTDDVPGGWESYPPEDRVPADLWDRDRSAAIEAVRDLCAWYADDPDASFPEVGPTPISGDGELLARPEVLGPLREWVREGARQGSVGLESDWIADLLPGASRSSTSMRMSTCGGARRIRWSVGHIRTTWPP